jgi:hypothetical protein
MQYNVELGIPIEHLLSEQSKTKEKLDQVGRSQEIPNVY